MKTLVIENNGQRRREAVERLREAGIEVVAVAKATIGLGFAYGQEFDSIVLDAVDMNSEGIPVLRRIRDLGVITPIVLLVAPECAEPNSPAEDAERFGCLRIPFGADRLVTALEMFALSARMSA